MTTSATSAAPRADRVETFLDWFRINSRMIAAGAAVVALAGLTYWFITRQAQNKAANADRQLQIARQSLLTGNAALAATDLQRVVQRWGDTPAGVQSAMLLAQIHYDKGEYQKGIEVLRKAAGDADASNKASLEALIADGESQLNKFDDAAASYRRAADAAAFTGQKAMYMASRARALQAGGKTQEAQAAWTELATRPEYSLVAGEAKVRLGELTAKPAARP